MLLIALAALAAGVAVSADAQTLLLVLDTPNPQQWAEFGYSLAMGDVNGDGKGDIAVGAQLEDVGGNVNQGRVYVFSPPPPYVGGIAEVPDTASSSAANHVPLAALAAAALVAVTAGAWYARRRPLR